MQWLFQEWGWSSLSFSFRFCISKKNTCISCLDYSLINKLYEVLWKFEDLWIYGIHKLDRALWWTPENINSDVYKKFKETYPFLENFYHFRLKQTELSRVFIWSDWVSNRIYILYFDPNWKLHH